jgi:poly(3-hydroxybutyrate) depolymerase
VEVTSGDRTIGRAALRMAVARGLEARIAALESASATAPASVQADVRYPLDFMRKVNRGLVEMGTFDLSSELRAAEAVAQAAAGGRDPFVGRTGDFERHYLLAGANEIMPYRVYVPPSYKAGTATALVIALHGLGGTEDSLFTSYQDVTPQLAERHGFLLAAPLGFRVDGFYGSRVMAGTDPAAARRSEYSEQDVLQVLEHMRASYTVDASRIFLIGHSMGAIGVWTLAARYPERWAAVAAFSGTGLPASVQRMAQIPQLSCMATAIPLSR